MQMASSDAQVLDHADLAEDVLQPIDSGYERLSEAL